MITIRLFIVCLEQPKKKLQTNYSFSRPIITDRNGIRLAVNLATFSLYTNPTKIKNKEELAKSLSKALNDISCDEIEKKLSTKNSFVWIKRRLTPNECYSVNNLGLPILQLKPAETRTYIFGNVFSHILGYVSIDNQGLAGIERYIDLKEYESEEIALSLDSRVQNILSEELKQVVNQYNALGGAGVILNANNGEILGIVSLPDFDPNRLHDSTDNQKFNRSTLGLYEFGSILKPFTLAAALDTDIINPKREYDISQPLKIGKYQIKDFHSHPTPKLTVEKIFTRSSNIGMAKIGLELSPELQKQYFSHLGLLSPLTLEISEKSNAITPKTWNNVVTASISYGYGISLTLLHVAQATAAIVNGGKLYQATLFPHNQAEYKRVIKEETSEQMRFLMQKVVKSGTGRRSNAKGYDVGGKTGSAEKSIKGAYVKHLNVSSFIGALPIESPKYVIAIMIDEPKPQGNSKFVTGGIVAAPTVKKIVNRIAPILNILPE